LEEGTVLDYSNNTRSNNWVQQERNGKKKANRSQSSTIRYDRKRQKSPGILRKLGLAGLVRGKTQSGDRKPNPKQKCDQPKLRKKPRDNKEGR